MSSSILSHAEMQALGEFEFFLTKAAIDAKISDLFGALKKEIEVTLQDPSFTFPAIISATPGRSYRGENLDHLPWRALDCPRYFQGTDIFCYRTLLIWGKSFSFHLLLAGASLRANQERLCNAHDRLAQAGWEMSLQSSPWDWSSSEFVAVDQLSAAEWAAAVAERDWIKLSIQLPLAQFDAVPTIGARLFRGLAEALW